MAESIEIEFADGTRAAWVVLSELQMDKITKFIEDELGSADSIRS